MSRKEKLREESGLSRVEYSWISVAVFGLGQLLLSKKI